MAYRFSQIKKVVPVPAPLDTTSAAAFPALGPGPGSSGSSGSSGSGKPSVAKPAMDFKKIAATPAVSAPVQAINKIEPKKIMVKPSSAVPTRCYDEFGEDYDGPDEWEEEKARDEYEVNASLPVGGRRGGF